MVIMSYYKLPRSAIDTIQRGTLPYDKIINQLFGKLKENLNNNADNKISFGVFSLIGKWLGPTFVVMSLMVLLAIAIPIAGYSFLYLIKRGFQIPRRCNNIMKHKYTCYTSLSIFVLANGSLLIGIILGFVSNAQLSSSLSNFHDSANVSFTTGFNYAHGTLNELNNTAHSQLEVALSSARTDLGYANRALVMPELDMLTPTFSTLVTNIIQLLNNLDMVYTDLIAINQSISALRSRSVEINSTLLSFAERFDEFLSECGGHTGCMADVPTNVFLNGLDGLSNPVNFTSAYGGLNLNDTRHRFSDTTEILANISTAVTNYFIGYELPYNSSVLSQVTSNLDTARKHLDRGHMDGVVQNYLNSVNDNIERYEVYRNLLCAILFLTFSGLLAPFACGLIFILAGINKKRTDLSIRGAKIIWIGVRASFTLSGFLLLFAVAYYLPSTILQKACNDLSPPDYVFLSKTFDNRSLWDGSTLLTTALRNRLNSSVDLSSTHILMQCSNNVPLHQVIPGLVIFNFSSLRSTFSTTQGFESFDFGCLADQVIDGILPTSTRMSVANLPQSIGNATYLSVYNAILNKPILSLRIVDLTLKLNELILYFAFQRLPDQAHAVNDFLLTEVNRLDRSVMLFGNERDLLRTQLNNLQLFLDTTREAAESFVTSFDTYRNQIAARVQPEVSDRLINQLHSHFTDYTNRLIDAAENQMGRCQPVADAYSDLHAAVCTEVLDGMNGIWCSVVWCVIVCLCLIITGKIVTTFFRSAEEIRREEEREVPLEFLNPFRNLYPSARPPREIPTRSPFQEKKPPVNVQPPTDGQPGEKEPPVNVQPPTDGQPGEKEPPVSVDGQSEGAVNVTPSLFSLQPPKPSSDVNKTSKVGQTPSCCSLKPPKSYRPTDTSTTLPSTTLPRRGTSHSAACLGGIVNYIRKTFSSNK